GGASSAGSAGRSGAAALRAAASATERRGGSGRSPCTGAAGAVGGLRGLGAPEGGARCGGGPRGEGGVSSTCRGEDVRSPPAAEDGVGLGRFLRHLEALIHVPEVLIAVAGAAALGDDDAGGCDELADERHEPGLAAEHLPRIHVALEARAELEQAADFLRARL